MTKVLQPLVSLALLAAAAPGGAAATMPLLLEGEREQALAVLQRVPLIDGHNDLPWQFRSRCRNHLGQLDIAQDLSGLEQPTQTDLPRARRGGLGGQFWSVWVPTGQEGAESVRQVFEQIDVVHRMVEHWPEHLELALTAADVERAHAAGRIACLIGMEGGHSIGDSLGVLRQTYRAGARYMTITHSSNVAWADSATDEPVVGGLTAFGREVIREMNRLGMLVDLSHVAPSTMRDALDVTAAPVAFSHSSARALTDHPRNVPDDVLRRMPDNGGVVMVTFVQSFVSEPVRGWGTQRDAERQRLEQEFPEDGERVRNALQVWSEAHPRPRATLEDVADHVEHVRRVAGIDHVGLGGDFDGMGPGPVGLEDVSKYPDLLAELLRRGWSEEEIARLAGRNVLRAMRAVEQVAARLQTERPPSDARIEELDPPTEADDHTPDR